MTTALKSLEGNITLKSFQGNVNFLGISELEISGETSAQMHVDIDVLIQVTRGRSSTYCLAFGATLLA